MKKILILGMLDSVHTARWIERIADMDCEIHIFPSRIHRKIHPLLLSLELEHPQVKIIRMFPSNRISPYVHFLLKKLSIGQFNLSNSFLKKLIKVNDFSHLHALELQHAGYLLLEVKIAVPGSTKVICTNWGSDIYYFRQFENDLAKIKEILSLADSYSAECNRDYELARELGFKGTELPLIPNSFKLDEKFIFNSDVKLRKQIIAKCYGELFGYGEIIIQVINDFLLRDKNATVLLYSVTDDLLSASKALELTFPSRVRVSTIRSPLTPNQIAKEFQKSRLYIGASRSDGISTSFLEAMNYGSFPIQTNTSCAQEWLEQGCIGVAVSPEREAILDALTRSYTDIELISSAALANKEVLKQVAGNERLKYIAQSFYG